MIISVLTSNWHRRNGDSSESSLCFLLSFCPPHSVVLHRHGRSLLLHPHPAGVAHRLCPLLERVLGGEDGGGQLSLLVRRYGDSCSFDNLCHREQLDESKEKAGKSCTDADKTKKNGVLKAVSKFDGVSFFVRGTHI